MRRSGAVAVAGALALAGAAACKQSDGGGRAGRGGERAPGGTTTGAPVSREPPSGPPLAGTSYYRVDVVDAAGCAASAPCEAKLLVTALDGYKVNEDYPYKFVAAGGAGVTVDGTGTFAIEAKDRGLMTIKFRADAAGPATISGKLKLSVCTAEVCKLEDPHVEFSIPVT